MSPVEPLLVTPEQAAVALGIGRTRLYALLAAGDLASVRIGTSRRIPVSALHDYVHRLGTQAHPEERPEDRRRASAIVENHPTKTKRARSPRPTDPVSEALVLPFETGAAAQ